MAESRRIPTPWRVKWTRFRSKALPVLTLLCCAALSALLWQRQFVAAHVVGEVETAHVDVAGVGDGVLAALPDGARVEPFRRVNEGDLIARMDDRLLRARRSDQQAKLLRLQQRLAEATAEAGAGAPESAAAKALRASIDAEQEKLTEVELRLLATEVRAPAAGTVSRVHRRPGESVRGGDPIVTIAADRPAGAPAYVVAYVRQDQRVRPSVGAAVEVRVTSPPNAHRVVRGQVQSVAGHVEPVPAHQLRDPKVPEWGQPVRIAAPAGAELRPGELVQVVFKPGA